MKRFLLFLLCGLSLAVSAKAQDAPPNPVFSVDIAASAASCPDQMEWNAALVLEKAMRAIPGCKMKFTAKNAMTMEGRKVLVSITATNRSCDIVDEAADAIVHEPEGDIVPVLPPDGLVVHWDKSFPPGQAFFDAIKTQFVATSSNSLPAGVAKNVILVEAGVGYPWKLNCRR